MAIRICIREIESSHKGKWFSPEAVKFFNSKVMEEAWEDETTRLRYFVSSEKMNTFHSDNCRRYTVRVQDKNGDIEPYVSDKNRKGYKTRNSAIRAMRKIAGV